VIARRATAIYRRASRCLIANPEASSLVADLPAPLQRVLRDLDWKERDLSRYVTHDNECARDAFSAVLTLLQLITQSPGRGSLLVLEYLANTPSYDAVLKMIANCEAAIAAYKRD
jgi:hypothetical protein